LSARPSDIALERLGVRLVTYDRPGYGRSDPHPGRVIADAADDVRFIANALGIETLSVLGRSGGAPHALACAALLPDRVDRVASLVGLAPYDAAGLDWLNGMADINREQYAAARLGRTALAELAYPQVIAMRTDPEHLARRLEEQGTPADRQALQDPAFRAAFLCSVREAVGRSYDGWAADSIALTHPWGFDLSWICVPTLLWHGAEDVFAPTAHADWLARRISGSLLYQSDEASHLDAVDIQDRAMEWLVTGDESCLRRRP
jgi:pimeloyl-ACP methyl ester carboxylesterase